MSFLDMLGVDETKSASELLKPLKNITDEKLGHPVDEFSFVIDYHTKEWMVTAEGKTQREKDQMFCFMLKKVIRMKLGKKTPDFNKCTIHYFKEKVNVILNLPNGETITQPL